MSRPERYYERERSRDHERDPYHHDRREHRSPRASRSSRPLYPDESVPEDGRWHRVQKQQQPSYELVPVRYAQQPVYHAPQPSPKPYSPSPPPSPKDPKELAEEEKKKEQLMMNPNNKLQFSMVVLAVICLLVAYAIILYASALGGDWYSVQTKITFRGVNEEAPLAIALIKRTFNLYRFEECVTFVDVDSENVDIIQEFAETEGCNNIRYSDADASSDRPDYINDIENAAITAAVFVAIAIATAVIGWFISLLELLRGKVQEQLDGQGSLRQLSLVFTVAHFMAGLLATASFFGIMQQELSTSPTDKCNAEGIGRFFIPQAPDGSPRSCVGTEDDEAEAITNVLSTQFKPVAWLPLVAAVLTFAIIFLQILRKKLHKVHLEQISPPLPREHMATPDQNGVFEQYALPEASQYTYHPGVSHHREYY